MKDGNCTNYDHGCDTMHCEGCHEHVAEKLPCEVCERVKDALRYADISHDYERAISIVERIYDGMTDDEIMAEDNGQVQ